MTERYEVCVFCVCVHKSRAFRQDEKSWTCAPGNGSSLYETTFMGSRFGVQSSELKMPTKYTKRHENMNMVCELNLPAIPLYRHSNRVLPDYPKLLYYVQDGYESHPSPPVQLSSY